MGNERTVNDTDEVDSNGGEYSLDRLIYLLSDRYVRHTLYYLSDESTITLDRLADVVAGLEAAESDAITTPHDRRRIRIRLHHVVLPKLDAAGFLRFDAVDDTVSEIDIPPVVNSLLNAIETSRIE